MQVVEGGGKSGCLCRLLGENLKLVVLNNDLADSFWQRLQVLCSAFWGTPAWAGTEAGEEIPLGLLGKLRQGTRM